MEADRLAALPLKLLATPRRAKSQRSLLRRAVPTQKSLKALARASPVNAVVALFLTRGLKSWRQRLHRLQGVSIHLQGTNTDTQLNDERQ
jgi:hypothetical protein